ncbi:carboxypeptidase regulatory-like domain-containing protein [Corallococcus exercitus]|uniref:Carboxypeptidase regulatory-like domain-containing protein n=1 Tax=Corallococcus exercitus TaxID=2316736 RepID=A0A7Y4KLX0_9BACT|nr:carboxypeptidase-like regulatory domain-containing protein [Corallococcus exercitus]NOK36151.1 carboxypeptidase regulatory-like domain-containing protein [Corallococcus exercitus]
MRWSWVGLVVVVLACAEAPRPVVKTRWPMEERTLTVRAVDALGQPIPGVTLRARRADRGSRVSRSGITDVNGTVQLRLMPGGYVAQAEAPGFVSVLRTDVRIAFDTEARWDLSMARAVPFEGRVVDMKGQPIEGVRFHLETLPIEDILEPLPGTESDAQGRFRFDGVPAGDGWLQLRAEKDGWSPVLLRRRAPQPELGVMMGGLGSLQVRALDPQGRPLPGRSVSIEGMGELRDLPFLKRESPDAALFENLPAELYRITGRYEPMPGCEWWRTIESQVLPVTRTDATVSFEDVPQGGPWRGRAVDLKGRPLAHGVVTAWMGGTGGVGMRGRCMARTEADGSFAIPFVFQAPSRLTWSVTDSMPGVERQAHPPSEADAPWVFSSGFGILKGRVLRPDGLPAWFFELDGYGVANPRGEYTQYVYASGRSQWVIGNVHGFAPALVRAEGRLEETVTVPDVLLEVGRTVRGRLVAADGWTNVARQEVELLEVFDLEVRGRHGPRKTDTDEDGRFEFEHVASRAQVLRVRAKGQGTVLQLLRPGEDSVKLRLVADAELQGTVTDGAKVPLAGVGLEVRCEGGFEAESGTDVAGRYSIQVPGDRECFVHAVARPLNVSTWHPPPVSFSPRRIRPSPASHPTLDIEARQGPGTVRVHVEASREFVSAFIVPGDVPLPGSGEALDALIREGLDAEPGYDSWDPGEGMPSFMAAARFSFGHLPLGTYTVFVRDEVDGGDSIARMTVVLQDAQVHTVTLERPAYRGGTFLPR